MTCRDTLMNQIASGVCEHAHAGSSCVSAVYCPANPYRIFHFLAFVLKVSSARTSYFETTPSSRMILLPFLCIGLLSVALYLGDMGCARMES